jgi:hypothetical protein
MGAMYSMTYGPLISGQVRQTIRSGVIGNRRALNRKNGGGLLSITRGVTHGVYTRGKRDFLKGNRDEHI